MKVGVTEQSSQDEKSKYPYLGIYTKERNVIVLFSETNVGTCVWTNTNTYLLGEFRSNWLEYHFEPFTGSITLTND